MTNVKKRSGEMQEFSRSKLEESMTRAGAKEEVAKRVAERIQPSEGLTTEEVRRKVGEELRKEDAAIADSYLSTRRLKAKMNEQVPVDAGRVSEHLAKIFEPQKGLLASLYHGARKADVRVEPAHKNYGEIWLNKAVLEQLAAQEGARIAVRFRLNTVPQPTGPTPPAQAATTTPPAAKAEPAMPAQQPH
ncbi:MAG TPA: hypothetical protein HA326_03340 [Thermoplasmata archaeon]|nr:hypothetical protein [Thermoplasmata archaeon]